MTDVSSRLLNDPRVREIVSRRRRMSFVLSVIVSLVYAVVALACAFAPELLQRPVFGSSVSLGLVSMAAIMVVGILCSGVYTWWSNTVRDPLVDEILQPDRSDRS